MDALLMIGKTYLPTPSILLVAHIVYSLWGACWLVIAKAIGPLDWSSFITLVFAIVPMAAMVAYIKYKKCSNIVDAIISGAAFFATIVGIQYYPWAAWIIGGRFGALVFNIVRVCVLTPLLLIYGLWAQEEIKEYLGAIRSDPEVDNATQI